MCLSFILRIKEARLQQVEHQLLWGHRHDAKRLKKTKQKQYFAQVKQVVSYLEANQVVLRQLAS